VQSGQAQVFTSVGLTPANASLLTGDTLSLTAVAQHQNGVPMAGLPAPNFISSNAAVAVVSAAGTFAYHCEPHPSMRAQVVVQ